MYGMLVDDEHGRRVQHSLSLKLCLYRKDTGHFTCLPYSTPTYGNNDDGCNVKECYGFAESVTAAGRRRGPVEVLLGCRGHGAAPIWNAVGTSQC